MQAAADRSEFVGNVAQSETSADSQQQNSSQLNLSQHSRERNQVVSSDQTSSQNTINKMDGQMSNLSAPKTSDRQSQNTSRNQDLQIEDIAAPEVRTRYRTQVEEMVVMQSIFTQTSLPNEEEKFRQSVAVQTHFPPDYEPQPYNVITEDGSVSYDSDGVRVLRAIGTWTPNYQNSEQFVDQNSQVYMNGSGTVSSPENSMIQQSVSNSPISAANCMASTHVNGEMGGEHSQGTSGDKHNAAKSEFVCPVCNKQLARKDKLVIHMRIHTGEKPYICEVCERAFARRDKLVMHMNKLKHLTPSNIAPLGKRQHQQSGSEVGSLQDKRQDVKLETQEMGSPASSVDLQPAALVQVVHEQPTMTWNCELCGRICLSREEWTMHARSHLDGDSNFASTSVSSGLSVLTPLSSYQYSGSASDRQTCVVCRQDFANKTDLILHLRTHFVGKPELLANHVASLNDSTGVCS